MENEKKSLSNGDKEKITSDAPKTEKPVPPPQSEQPKWQPGLCPNCKTVNDVDVKFCDGCGTRLY